ncbi:MAG: twin-arginine translocation signal domain-containing protein, partial [Candidatus Lindowbacteria bacterium]|nr:twin-arginine translocation signal domain-containing protein [Candidatus Lindowbacteria bacterium]
MDTEKGNVTRRSFIRKSALATAAVGGAVFLGVEVRRWLSTSYSYDATLTKADTSHMLTVLDVINPNAPRPNILMIYADDLG